RAEPPDVAGFVDGSAFARLAGDEAVKVEITLKGGLLHALAGADEELAQMARGLDSIEAVILDIGETAMTDRLRELIGKTEKQLIGKGWERLARVVEPGSEVKVLVLSDQSSIQGLVVMIVDEQARQVVFANVAGKLDLAAISRMGEDLEIPGLDRLQREKKEDEKREEPEEQEDE